MDVGEELDDLLGLGSTGVNFLNCLTLPSVSSLEFSEYSFGEDPLSMEDVDDFDEVVRGGEVTPSSSDEGEREYTELAIVPHTPPSAAGSGLGMSASEAHSFVQSYIVDRPDVAREALLRRGDLVVPCQLLPQRASSYAEASRSGEGSQYFVSEAGKFTSDPVSETSARSGSQTGGLAAARHVKLSAGVQQRVEKIMANNFRLDSHNFGVVVDALLRKFLAMYDAFHAAARGSGLALEDDDARLMIPLRSANAKSKNPEKVDWLESFLKGVPAQLDDGVPDDKDLRPLSRKSFTPLNRQSAINLGLTTVSTLTKCFIGSFVVLLQTSFHEVNFVTSLQLSRSELIWRLPRC
jgi:hypothetical protein